jgi:formamidopyrimidine-DNA glycosylase
MLLPELPEVECITRDLRHHCVGKKITGVQFLFLGILRGPDPADFIQRVVGCFIQEVGRKGKYILLYLNSGEVMEIHLRMTGNLLYYSNPVTPNKYVRAVFVINEHSLLFFQDIRKFGTLRLWSKQELPKAPSSLLGCNPLGAEFSLGFFQTLLQGKPKRTIKSFLLDQGNIAGMGNIYTDEALFRSGIHPARKAGSLSTFEAEQLYVAICSILKEAIALRGTSFSDYRDLAGEKGGFQELLQVYRRKGKPCFRCGREIQRCVIAGRGTFYCSFCQPFLE